MKKILIGTSALVAVGLLAAPTAKAEGPQLTVGGYMEQWIGYADNDEINGTTEYQKFDQQSDSEVYFNTSTTLDNGFTIRTIVQIETDTSAQNSTQADHMDESYLRITHDSYGDLRLGSTKNAMAVIAHGAPDVGISLGDIDNWVPNPGGSASEFGSGDWGVLDTPNDEAGVHYYSPQLFGFTIGASYMPNTTDSQTLSTTTDDVWGAGIVYNGEISGVSLDANIAWAQAGDNQHFNYGLNVGYAGFTVGGALAVVDQDSSAGTIGTVTTADGSGTGFEVGVSYETGPYAVSLVWGQTEYRDGTDVEGDTEADALMLSGRYDLGEGVELKGSIFAVDWDDEDDSTTTLVDNEGWGIVTGIDVSF